MNRVGILTEGYRLNKIVDLRKKEGEGESKRTTREVLFLFCQSLGVSPWLF